MKYEWNTCLENLAVSDPTLLQVDPSVTFDQIGGLDGYIDKLKEMIFLPLVYPELLQRFQITPPRGVLFYGPPGGSPAPQSASAFRSAAKHCALFSAAA